MARIGETQTVCDLCGGNAGYMSREAKTAFQIKGKALVLEASGTLDAPDLCAKCLAGIISEGRVMPIEYSNKPFFTPGLFLGFVGGFGIAQVVHHFAK